MKKQVRYDGLGAIVMMAAASGYVMVRRPGCLPFVKSAKEWVALSETPIHPSHELRTKSGKA